MGSIRAVIRYSWKTPRRSRWPRIIGFIGAGFLLLIIAAAMIPCFVVSRSAANESSAVGSLRTITTAQIEFSKHHPEKGFATSLAELGPSLGDTTGDEQLAITLASGTKSGYIFTMTPGTPDAAGHIAKFAVTASPRIFAKTGTRSFFVDESVVIRYTSENRHAFASDPPLS